jgi:hypothetical protein
MNAVRTLCDRAFLLDHGHGIEYGETKSVVDFYENRIIKQIHKGESELLIIKVNTEKKEGKSGLDTGEVKLKSIKILNENDEEISFIESERNVKIVFEITSTKDLADPHFGLTIRNYLGQTIFQIDTDSMRLKPKKLFASQIAIITFFLNIPLFPGNYTVSIGIANKGNGVGTFEEYLLFIQDAELLKVTPNPNAILYSGIFNINPRVTIQAYDNSDMVH